MKPTRLPLPKKNRISLLMLMLCICVPNNALGVEELDYELISQFGDIEIRSYKAHELATVNIESGFTRAGYSAFRYLFKYISGENQEQKKNSDDSSGSPTTWRNRLVCIIRNAAI